MTLAEDVLSYHAPVEVGNIGEVCPACSRPNFPAAFPCVPYRLAVTVREVEALAVEWLSRDPAPHVQVEPEDDTRRKAGARILAITKGDKT